jgi:hypothetical protein
MDDVIIGAQRRYKDGATKTAPVEKVKLTEDILDPGGTVRYVGHFALDENTTPLTVQRVENGYVVKVNGETHIASGPEMVGRIVTKAVSRSTAEEPDDAKG